MPEARKVNSGDQANLVRAPEFPVGLTWFNTKEPLSIKGLRGKIVVLDFWTYGCINCLHVLPDLEFLASKYARQVVVISVHTAKFETENEPEPLRQAVLRIGLEHPVVADLNRRLWNEYAVRAWPTLIVIDPDGRIAASFEGEGHRAALDATVESLMERFRAAQKLNETSLQIALERSKVATTLLRFPGKVTVEGDKLFVADSGHNRIVIADAHGKRVEMVVGSGEAGLQDGDFASARFSNPQGLAVQGNMVYVADTNNHAVRILDLQAQTVVTLAGNGEQANWGAQGGVGVEARLASPWDIAQHGDTLYLAMAGLHQIWSVDIPSREVSVFSGLGGEARRDGPREEACFAQPSGIVWAQNDDKPQLYVADAESSSLRVVSPQNGSVRTLAGGDLFDFGDHDARGLEARLQHPLGVAWNRFDARDQGLYFCDTYNSKIKRADTRTSEVTTLNCAGLNEPGGLDFLDAHTLIIADTNHNALKTFDLLTQQVEEFGLVGLTAPKRQEEATAPTREAARILAPDARVRFVFDSTLPPKFHFNRAAPFFLEIKVDGSTTGNLIQRLEGDQIQIPASIEFQTLGVGQGSLHISGVLSYCSEDENAVCKTETLNRVIPFEVQAEGERELKVAIELT